MSKRLFEDFGQQAVYEALRVRGAEMWEAERAAKATPKWSGDDWRSIEKHVEEGAKMVRVGLDAEHTRLLRERDKLEREMDKVESAISAIESRLWAEVEAQEAA